MSKDKEVKLHPNLSRVDGTLASVVEENAGELKRIIEDSSITVDDTKQYVLELLESCKQSPWIKKAKVDLDRMTDKNTIAFFIYNSFLSGENLKTLR